MAKIKQLSGDLLDNPDTRQPETGGKRSKNQNIEEWLTLTYQFRYNLIKQIPEYRLAEDTKAPFLPMDDYTLNSILRQLDAFGLATSSANLSQILRGSYSPAINPVKDYFKKLFPWDEVTDHIGSLCNTVTAKNPADWHQYLTKWLVGVVANVFIDEKCANHVMLVLTGSQGKYKTSWLQNLCPKNLKRYSFCGKLNLESKDSLTLIAENLFVNIDDQLKQLHKKDENELKSLITQDYVTYRRPYDKFITEYPHLCSFMGSVNGNEFLNDPTGSRRFLPFEVDNIDIKAAQALNIDLIWAQAYTLFKKGMRYWFEDQEIDLLNERNASFSMITQEQELLQYYFSTNVPANSLHSLKFYPTSIIKSKLEVLTHSKLSERKLGEALTKCSFIKQQRTISNNRVWGWICYEKTSEEVGTQSIDTQQTVQQQPQLQTADNEDLPF